ncbi:MAG: hypothetical protein WA009_01355 [Phototrophicaceae bacterium]|nr:MAG: hypothetical protein UZ13_03396 [Chloroflexi bacterium OLB13]MEB2365850.1 hypothetical protein [Chloroflexota bacterium]GIK28960.1 MAG: hypothetical protein BroJett007_20980 [Chloroflexota bacterium]
MFIDPIGHVQLVRAEAIRRAEKQRLVKLLKLARLTARSAARTA